MNANELKCHFKSTGSQEEGYGLLTQSKLYFLPLSLSLSLSLSISVY